MIIANPIYDTVFKYMMESTDIARGFIGVIIGQEIEHLDFKAQEQIVRENQLRYFHLDFIARIREKNGEFKNVLIEVQKSNSPIDLMRFRKYLGEQYKKNDEVPNKKGGLTRGPLPIITIYILGFRISKTLPAVIHVNRNYIDMLTGETITEKNEFIECLTHDTYVIQIPSLNLSMKNRLEHVLSCFKQENFLEDSRLKAYNYEPSDELVKQMLKKLEMAASTPDMLHRLELEEMARREYEIAITPFVEKIQKSALRLQKSEKTVKKQKIKIEKQDKALVEKDKVIEEKDKALEDQARYIRELEEKTKTQKMINIS